MATILARTDRVRVFPDLACLPLLPPAMMAKAAASLDVISGGRFELGLGAGGFWEAIDAMGGPARGGESPGSGASAFAPRPYPPSLLVSRRGVSTAGHVQGLPGRGSALIVADGGFLRCHGSPGNGLPRAIL